MNGAGSRNKGNAFERKIAKILGRHFGFDVRRVPASGGLDIKCDIYCPFDDRFPLYVECKNRKSFVFDSILNGKSDLFKFWDKLVYDLSRSYLMQKYTEYRPIPVVIFRGGHFGGDMVMYSGTKSWGGIVPGIYKGPFVFATLTDFLKICPKTPLS